MKRDDLTDPLLSGNKYRKLHHLIEQPASTLQEVWSHGGLQSNAMLAMAALCQRKGWQFHYLAKVARHVSQNPVGNLALALDLGMQLHEVAVDVYEQKLQSLRQLSQPGTLFLPQGGADPLAQQGIARLAQEIVDWQCEQDIETLAVVTPAGTGTTAFYLAHALPTLQVLTTPMVADADDLRMQMGVLGSIPENLTILTQQKRYRFAAPYPEFLQLYEALLHAGIEFDLIYGVRMWHTLLHHLSDISAEILYVHSGGLTGNATMLTRYR